MMKKRKYTRQKGRGARGTIKRKQRGGRIIQPTGHLGATNRSNRQQRQRMKGRKQRGRGRVLDWFKGLGLGLAKKLKKTAANLTKNLLSAVVSGKRGKDLLSVVGNSLQNSVKGTISRKRRRKKR